MLTVIAAWTPTTQISPAHWRINPLLDLPLKPYAGMSKARVWEMFVDWLAASDAKWILDEEQSWVPPNHLTVDPDTMQPLTDAAADGQHARMMAWWKENQEAPLRPSDPAAAVSVWLWRNGLRDQAVDVFAKIWRTVRAEQEGIPWTDTERRRRIDLYQGGFIERPELRRRASEVASRRKELQHKRTSLADERTALARDNQLRHRVHDFAARIHAFIDTLDDTQKQQLLRLLIEDVRVTGWHVQIRLRIAVDPPPPHPTGPTGTPSPHPSAVSTQDGLRSVGGDDFAVVDEAIMAGRDDVVAEDFASAAESFVIGQQLLNVDRVR